MRTKWASVLSGACVLIAAACSGGSGSSDAQPTSDSTNEVNSVESLPSADDSVPDIVYSNAWVDVPAPEGCVCADGAPFSFQLREADPTKVLVVLSEGQFCYTGGACYAIPRFWYGDTTFWEGTGIFDFSHPENPFADHTVVFVPNCTLDGLVGSYVADYLQAGQVHHTGHVNASSIVSWAAERYPSAQRVSIVGLGMGGWAAPMISGLTSVLWPRARTDVIVDSSAAAPDDFAGITSAWGFLSGFHPIAGFSTLSYETLTMTSTYELIAKEFPDIRFARVNFAEDAFIRRDTESVGFPPFDMKQIILEGETRIESIGNPVATWIAPGADHLALDGQSLFDMSLGGVRFIDWFRDFLDGGDVADQVCTICTM